MRFIGSKAHLLKEIDDILAPHLTGKETSFVDLFAGSTVVAEHFKPSYAITTNDLMKFSQVLALGGIALNDIPTFDGLKNAGISDPFKYLEMTDLSNYPGGFATKEYSPSGNDGRMYFQTYNAKRIDFIRDKLDEWHQVKLINDNEFYYLLSSLIRAIPYISNITGTYGAYLKHWDKRSYKPLKLEASDIIDNEFINKALSEDAVELVKKISADIAYIDTPYNNRQYAPNYHVLESIARNDKPTLHGITGQRDYADTKSDFAIKKKAFNAMTELIHNLNFSHVVISYSTDGIIPEDQMLELLRSSALNGEVVEKRIPYRKYKSKIVIPNNQLYELLFYFQPKTAEIISAPSKTHRKVRKETANMGYIKSPLNYIGGKYKMLPQIEPLFPKKIDTFLDLFSGGGNVGINSNAKKVYFNDINSKINDLFRYFQGKDPDDLINLINSRINDYHLSKTNENGFLEFRRQYNITPNPLDLYVLAAYSFNYQFRFNNRLEYNNPFGRNRSHFSERMANNLKRFVNQLNQMDAHFTDNYFSHFDFSILTNNSFVYADPPYLITTGSYNDGKRGFGDWTEKQETELYSVLDNLNNHGIKFAMSNVTDHKGRSNDLLKQWSKNYKIHELKYGYQNSSYNTVALESREVLITNY